MNKYAQTALIAAKYVRNGISPEKAWYKASCEVFKEGSSSQKKGCPKNAFLGLYGINTDSKNAQYALTALSYIREHSFSDINPKELWKIVLSGENKAYNSQMHIVIVLYKEGFIQ